MKRHIGASLLIVFILIGLAGCSEKTESKPTETKDFVYVSAPSSEEKDIPMLNQWLRTNPNKKVISFSGVLEYRNNVSGYIMYFVPGDNSHQNFARVNRDDRTSQKPTTTAHGINFLQDWKDAHPNDRIIAVSTIPAYSGGVKDYTICYEK